MKGLLKEYADERAPLPEPVAEIVVDSASKGEAAPLPDRSQTLMDRRLPGGDPEAPVEAEDDGEDHTLMRIHRALEERGISTELRGDGAYDARYVFSLLKSLDITPLVSVRRLQHPRQGQGPVPGRAGSAGRGGRLHRPGDGPHDYIGAPGQPK